MTGFAPLIADGFVLGWSVAWPPGPINAEMVRRGLTRGFMPAFSVGLGACSGDALWAAFVALGAGFLVGPQARFALALISTALLFFLAAIFLAGAWRRWHDRGQEIAPNEACGFRGARSGYVLGLFMALSSPWNLAFWLAVIGRSESLQQGFAGALVIAFSVILGAASWCVVLCTTTARLGFAATGAIWAVVAQTATGLLMLGFGLRGVWLLATG